MIDLTVEIRAKQGLDTPSSREELGNVTGNSSYEDDVENIVPSSALNLEPSPAQPIDLCSPHKLAKRPTIGERVPHSRKPKTKNPKLSDVAMGFNEYARKAEVDNVQFASSDVAALCGLNKYSRPGELLFKYVYKGFPNLMKMDAANLDISIISEQQKVEELMAQTSEAKILKSVLKASKDGKQVKSVADVETFGKQATAAIKTALQNKELPVHEISELQRAINSSLFTNFGNRKENTALQEYEERTGYFVSENNEECYQMTVATTSDDAMDSTDDTKSIPRKYNKAASFGIVGFIDGIALVPPEEVTKLLSTATVDKVSDKGSASAKGVALVPPEEVTKLLSTATGDKVSSTGDKVSDKGSASAKGATPQKRPLRNPAWKPKYPKKAKGAAKDKSPKPIAKSNTLGKYFAISKNEKEKVKSPKDTHSTDRGVTCATPPMSTENDTLGLDNNTPGYPARTPTHTETKMYIDEAVRKGLANDQNTLSENSTLSIQDTQQEKQQLNRSPTVSLTTPTSSGLQLNISADGFEDALKIVPTQKLIAQAHTAQEALPKTHTHTHTPASKRACNTKQITPRTQPRRRAKMGSSSNSSSKVITPRELCGSELTEVAHPNISKSRQCHEMDQTHTSVSVMATGSAQTPQNINGLRSKDPDSQVENGSLSSNARASREASTHRSPQAQGVATASVKTQPECVLQETLAERGITDSTGAEVERGELHSGVGIGITGAEVERGELHSGVGIGITGAEVERGELQSGVGVGTTGAGVERGKIQGGVGGRMDCSGNDANTQVETTEGPSEVKLDRVGEQATIGAEKIGSLDSPSNDEGEKIEPEHLERQHNDSGVVANSGDVEPGVTGSAISGQAGTEVGNQTADVEKVTTTTTSGIGEQLDNTVNEEGPKADAPGMQKLVVEIKNRAGGRIYTPPHLHEQIQVLVYLKLTGCTQGDLVQYVDSDRGKGESLMDITRVKLDDFRSADVWESIIVPRLSDFCQTVHRVRQDDGLRTLLMQNSTSDNSDARDDLAVSLCPSMEHASSDRGSRNKFRGNH